MGVFGKVEDWLMFVRWEGEKVTRWQGSVCI